MFNKIYQSLPSLSRKCEICFPGDITEKRRSTISASFQKLCHGIKTPRKDKLIIFGSALGPNSQADLFEKKIVELEKVIRIVEKVDAHCGFVCWKIASVCQICCTSWEPVHVLINQLSWKSLTKPYATGFPECVTWTSTKFRVLSWLCPLKWVVIRCHPHLSAFCIFHLFGLSFWCEWLSHDNFIGNIRKCFIYKSAWEIVEFDKCTGKSSRWTPENLDTTCLRQNRPRIDFWNGWQTFESFQRSSRQTRVSMSELRSL